MVDESGMESGRGVWMQGGWSARPRGDAKGRMEGWRDGGSEEDGRRKSVEVAGQKAKGRQKTKDEKRKREEKKRRERETEGNVDDVSVSVCLCVRSMDSLTPLGLHTANAALGGRGWPGRLAQRDRQTQHTAWQTKQSTLNTL